MNILSSARLLGAAILVATIAPATAQTFPNKPVRAEDMLGIRTVSTAVCTVRRMLDHLGLEPVSPGAGALLSSG